MPSMHIKKSGAWEKLDRGEVQSKFAGAIAEVDNIWLKNAGEWYPMFPLIALARWGYATFSGPDLLQNGHTGPTDFINGLTNIMPSNDDNEEFTYQLPDADTFAYFAVPKQMGLANFYDINAGFSGAWDGATWSFDPFSDGSFMNTGPIEVTYDGELWYVYRSDFAGTSIDVDWRITYPNRPAA